MAPGGQAQVLGSLYLLYRAHARGLCGVGYSREEASWLHCACLPSLPWQMQAKEKITLTQILRLYVGIYQYEWRDVIEPEHVPAFLELLIDRYRMAAQIMSTGDPQASYDELARFALPGVSDVAKLGQAAGIVRHTIGEWQTQGADERLPCALVDDIGDALDGE